MVAFVLICLCLISSVVAEREIIRGARATNSSLKKKLSDLHFQLFTSIQKQTKMIKSAVFETQCTGTGCTFNGCEAGEGNTCDGQMMSKLQQIQSSIGKLNIPTRVACDSGWRKYGKRCYKEMRQKLNWFNAQMFCRQHGGSLARINSAEEKDWFKKHYRTSDLWIDLTDLGKEGQWKWFSTGRTTAYKQWDRHQPNNAGSREHCVTTNFRHKIGIWNDWPCTNKHGFICEV